MKFLEIAGNQNKGSDWITIRDKEVSDKFGLKQNCILHDVTDLPLDINDNFFVGIYSEHFIEHLEKEQGINFLKEMYRILKPGGIIRTVWPSMDFVDFLRSDKDLSDTYFVKAYYNRFVLKYGYAPPDSRDKPLQEQCALSLLYQAGEHKHLWYKQELIDKLKEIGFVKVNECEYQQSSFLPFNNIDTPGRIRQVHSAVVEAWKE